MAKILCNGVNLNYCISGTGEKSFILLHNAGGNLHFMNYQLHHLSQKGRDTVMSCNSFFLFLTIFFPQQSFYL